VIEGSREEMFVLILLNVLLFSRHHGNNANSVRKGKIIQYIGEQIADQMTDDVNDIDFTWVSIPTRKLKSPKCILDKRFLSFTIDIIEMKRQFRCIPLLNKRINILANGLSPAYLRVGGTPQDFLTFDYHMLEETNYENNEMKSNCTPRFESWRKIKKFSLSIDLFDRIAQFAERNNLDLIFGLNARQRNEFDSWDFENIKKVIDHAKRKNYRNIAWEIGNEPNRYRKYGKDQIVTPSQLSSYFKKLNDYIPHDRLFGPDVSHPKYKTLRYLKEFLDTKPPIHAVTYHQYQMHETESTEEKYIDPGYVDVLHEQMLKIRNIMRDTNTTIDIWLGEAGSSSGGGKNGLSDRYIAGFLYMAKIGLTALNCHKVMIRQSFYGGHYGMLDAITRKPLPDYWITYVYKKLVSDIYLHDYLTSNNRLKVHAYCHKTNKDDVTLLYINFRQDDIYFLLEEFEFYNVEVYILKPEDNNILSKTVLLNDKVLTTDLDGNLPEINGQLVQQPVTIPRLSYGYMVIKNIFVDACQKNII